MPPPVRTPAGSGWAPPPEWAPPTDAPRRLAGPTATTVGVARRKAWLVLAGMLALLMIYLCVITYWLNVHMVDRYEPAAPGATVVVRDTEYTLLELRRVQALPQGAGETKDPVVGEAYVVAKVRILSHDPEYPKLSCGLTLLGPKDRTWEYSYQSALDPQTEDADYCDAVRTDHPAEVTIGYAIPASDIDQVRGVVVAGYNGSVDRVLVPPHDGG